MIRPATDADLDAIDEIERASFRIPWPRETFAAELRRDWARIDVVDRGPGPIVGFCNYWLVAGEIHVLAIATHPAHRRRGIAAALVDHVLETGRVHGCTLATLEVRRGNTPAIALYERAGFRTVHVRTRYYQDDGEDALVMLTEFRP
jgi:ribosomal-protein-alanine N-acetyltransferase